MWSYKVTDKGNLSVYDHTDSHVTTVMNGGTGVRVPDDVLSVMGDELDARGWDMSTAWVQQTVKDALLEDIAER